VCISIAEKKTLFLKKTVENMSLLNLPNIFFQKTKLFSKVWPMFFKENKEFVT
jgi:hypothetical protein